MASVVKIHKQGLLKKQGGSKGGWKTWKLRWFVQDENKLSYYDSEEDYLKKKPALDAILITELTVTDSFERTFFLVHGDRMIQVKAKTEDLKAEWLKSLSKPQRPNKSIDILFGKGIKIDPDAEEEDTQLEDEDKDNQDPTNALFMFTDAVDTTPWDIAPTADDKSSFSVSPSDSSPLSLGTPTSIHSVPSSLSSHHTTDSLMSISTKSDISSTSSSSVSPSSHSHSAKLDFSLPPPPPLPSESKREQVQILKASLEELFDVLVSPELSPDVLGTFLMNYQSFLKPEAFLAELIRIFDIPACDYTVSKVCIGRRTQIICVLKEWVTEYPGDFTGNMQMDMCNFLKRSTKSTTKGVDSLADHMELMLQQSAEEEKIKAKKATQSLPSDKFLQKFVADVDIADFKAEQIANQLTQNEFQIFKVIGKREFYNKAWCDPNTCNKRAPNLMQLINSFNKISFWVATEILTREDPAIRKKMIGKFIKVAFHCRRLHNFHGAFEIINGLSLNPVYRLKASWNGLTNKLKLMFDELKTIITSANNYAIYRKAFMSGLGKPQIPHLAVILRDLFAIDGIATKDADGSVCFHKFQKQWKELAFLYQCQKIDYHLPAEPNMAMALQKLTKKSLNEDQLYKRSQRLEPPEK